MRTATVRRAAALGALSGMRSLAGLTALGFRLRRKRSRHPAARLLKAATMRRVLPLLAGSELLADKLPFMPDRTEPLPLAARALIGALAGGILASEERGSVLVGGAIGAVSAIAVTYVAYHARKYARERLSAPDGMIAGVEDSLVIGIGAALRRA